MKKSSFGRIIALALVLATILGAFGNTGVAVQAATAEEVTRLFVESYNDSVVLRDGEKVTESLIQRLGVILKGQTDSGKVVPLPIQIKEKGTYLHAVQGRAKFTLYYGDVTKTLSVPVKVKAKKLTVKVKKKATLPEGQKLTMGMVNSVLKSDLVYKDGKKVKNFKGYLCKEVGRTIRPNKKGKVKLTTYVGGVKKKVFVKVNRIKRIYIAKAPYSQVFEEEAISSEIFRSKNTVMAAYKKGRNRKLLTYGISIKGDVATVKYAGKKDTIKFKRVPKPVAPNTPAPQVTPEAPKEEPTLVPTDEPTATPEQPTKPPVSTGEPTATPETPAPTVTPSEQPTATPEQPTKPPVSTGEPTATPETPAPTVTPSEQPTATPEQPTKPPVSTGEPTATPATPAPTVTPSTATPTPTPLPKLTLSMEGEGSLFINDGQVEAGEISLENGSYRLRVEEKPGYEFDSIQDGDGNILTDKNVYTFDLTGNTTIHVVLVKTWTVSLDRGIGKVTVDGADAIFQNGVATMEVREGTEMMLETSSTSEYRFTRYATSKGAELSTNTTYKFTVTSDLSIVAVFERLYAFTVKREGLGGVRMGEKMIKFSNNSYTENVVTGNQALTAVENDDYRFVGWFYENSAKPFSDKLSISVPVNVATTVVAKFAEKEKTVTVQYTTDDGTVLKSEAVPFGESLTPPSVNGAHGMVFVGWQIADVDTPTVYRKNEEGDFVSGTQTLAEAIAIQTAEKKAVTVVAVFEAEPTNYYSFSVSGASITSIEDGEQNEEGKYSERTHFFLDADVPDGYSVEGWYNTITGDKVRGPYETYDFVIQKDTSIEVRFTKDPAPEPEPLLSWKEYYPDFNKKMLVLIPNVQIPKKYEIIKWGVLMTTKSEEEIPTNEITIYNTKVLNVQAKKETDEETGEEYYPSNHTVTISQSWSSVFDNSKTVRVLIYATIDDGTGSKTIYSDKPVTIYCGTAN